MENIKPDKPEAIAPILKNNHQAKSPIRDKFDRVQRELDRANSRMKAANTLAERSEQLSQKVLKGLLPITQLIETLRQEELEGLLPIPSQLDEVPQLLQEIKYCISLISYCLISDNYDPIAVNLISELKENPESFYLSADCLIAVFNCLKENHGLTDEAKDAANEYIEGAIGALTELGTSQLKIPEKSEILTLEEIKEKYPQQWVLIAYNERDEYLNVIRGEVLAYSPDCDEIDNYLPYTKGTAVAIEYTGPIPEEIGILL